MKKLLLSIAFLLPGMGMMAQTQVTTAKGILEGKDLSGITVFKGIPFAAPPVGKSPLEGSTACTEMAGRSRGQGVRTEPDAGTSLRRYELRYEDQQRGLPLP